MSRTMPFAAVLFLLSPQDVSAISLAEYRSQGLGNQASLGTYQPVWPYSESNEQLLELSNQLEPESGYRIHNDMSELSRQLKLETGRLVAQQRLAMLQLQQASVSSQNAMGDLQMAPPSAQFLQQQPQLALTQLGSYRPLKTSVALPQTGEEAVSEANRQRNPALAALLAWEPLLNWYYALACAAFVLFTGMSSAICAYAGKLPFRCANQVQAPPSQGEANGSLPAEAEEKQRFSIRGYFQYPGRLISKFSQHEPHEQPQPTAAAPPSAKRSKKNDSRVETWTKVPLRSSPQQGYLDDSDDGGDHAHGFVDEC